MKILYLRTVFWLNVKAGGSVGHTSGVINALDKVTNLDVISNAPLPGVDRPLEILAPSQLLSFLPMQIREFMYNMRIYKRLRRKAFIQKYDAIYQRYSGVSFAAAFCCAKAGIPYILEFNSSEVWKTKNWTEKGTFITSVLNKVYKKGLLLPIIKRSERYNLAQASLIVVVSEVSKENLVREGIPPEKILVNPNGIDPLKYSPHIDGIDIRKRYHLGGHIVFGFIGSFGQWHGVVELARAIVHFFNTHPQHRENIRFMLIGDGILMPQVKKILQPLLHEKVVFLTGLVPQDDGPAYLAACDILLSPHVPNPDGSKFFGSPTKLFEYMGMAKPIIASDLDQIGDVLENGRTAILVKPGDSEALSEAMHNMLSNPEPNTMLGMAARSEVLAHYTWDKHVARILAQLNERL